MTTNYSRRGFLQIIGGGALGLFAAVILKPFTDNRFLLESLFNKITAEPVADLPEDIDTSIEMSQELIDIYRSTFSDFQKIIMSPEVFLSLIQRNKNTALPYYSQFRKEKSGTDVTYQQYFTTIFLPSLFKECRQQEMDPFVLINLLRDSYSVRELNNDLSEAHSQRVAALFTVHHDLVRLVLSPEELQAKLGSFNFDDPITSLLRRLARSGTNRSDEFDEKKPMIIFSLWRLLMPSIGGVDSEINVLARAIMSNADLPAFIQMFPEEYAAFSEFSQCIDEVRRLKVELAKVTDEFFEQDMGILGAFFGENKAGHLAAIGFDIENPERIRPQIFRYTVASQKVLYQNLDFNNDHDLFKTAAQNAITYFEEMYTRDQKEARYTLLKDQVDNISFEGEPVFLNYIYSLASTTEQQERITRMVAALQALKEQEAKAQILMLGKLFDLINAQNGNLEFNNFIRVAMYKYYSKLAEGVCGELEESTAQKFDIYRRNSLLNIYLAWILRNMAPIEFLMNERALGEWPLSNRIDGPLNVGDTLEAFGDFLNEACGGEGALYPQEVDGFDGQYIISGVDNILGLLWALANRSEAEKVGIWFSREEIDRFNLSIYKLWGSSADGWGGTPDKIIQPYRANPSFGPTPNDRGGRIVG